MSVIRMKNREKGSIENTEKNQHITWTVVQWKKENDQYQRRTYY